MRLIDADALYIPSEEMNARMAVTYAPTVDAVPVVHGKWREVEVDKRIVYFCTVCHTVAHMPNHATFGLYDYCPHCGAKMDGGADDDR